ncbi:MAG: PstS family phosphate ABC transporter substrate-binding protein [Desulfomonilaceae bacterium]
MRSKGNHPIRNIYTGKTTSWADLGWQRDRFSPYVIRPYRRNRNSGSEEKMQKLVIKGLPNASLLPLDALTLGSMFGPFNSLIQDQQGIGYTPYYYERFMANTPQVKMIAVNNVMPSHETIKNGTYPLITEVVVAYLSDLPKDSAAAKIRDWLLTVDGQQVVAESGYIPIRE